jgi:hypothetical protein
MCYSVKGFGMVGPEVATPHHKHSEQKDPCLGPEQNECLGMVGPEVATPHHKHSEQKDPCLGTVGPEVATPHHKQSSETTASKS